MRPSGGFNEAAGIPRGKRIRLRRSSAVNLVARFNEAAGIPRGKPRFQINPRSFNEARYSPRKPLVTWVSISTCFNEAAGIPRGKRDRRVPCARHDRIRASMRPRVFPAENTRSWHHLSEKWLRVSPKTSRTEWPEQPVTGFNEAAGIPRGKRRSRCPRCRCRGLQPRPRRKIRDLRLAAAASMRPRVFPAENRSGVAR